MAIVHVHSEDQSDMQMGGTLAMSRMRMLMLEQYSCRQKDELDVLECFSERVPTTTTMAGLDVNAHDNDCQVENIR